MRTSTVLAALIATVTAHALPAVAADAPAAVPVTHEELGRAFDDVVGQMQGLGERFRSHFAPGDGPPERPVISIMLDHRRDLGLTPVQVQELERLRAAFQREGIKLDADRRVAQMDLAALLAADPVDLNRVETKVREIEHLRGDLRLGRIRAIEQGKAQLTPEQRAKLQSLLAEPGSSTPRAWQTPLPPPSERPQRF